MLIIPLVKGKATSDTVAAAWAKFKKDLPKTYEKYLRAWDQLKELEKPRSMSTRAREFAIFKAKLEALVRVLSR